MANVIYPKARQRFCQGDLHWKAVGGDTFRAVLVDLADYTYSDTHEFLSDVPAAARVATTGALTLADPADGVLDADDITIASVTGDPIGALIIYKDAGTESTSPLVLFIDHDASANALTFTPNGGSCTITWPNGATKIAKL
jgi:hypothetical protein